MLKHSSRLSAGFRRHSNCVSTPCHRHAAVGHHHSSVAVSNGRQLRQVVRAQAADGSSSSSSSSNSVGAVEVIPPFTVEELQGFDQEDDAAEEQRTGDFIRDFVSEDPEALFDYPARQLLEVVDDLDGMLASRQLGPLPAGVVSEMLGMGSWRLRDRANEVISFLVSRIEGSMREMLPDDFSLYPPEKWKGHGWDFIDSMDPKREWDSFSYVDIADPAKGEEGYPRLLIENRVYSSRVFRKMHLEVAWRQDGLQVLHVVMYPRYEFDLPILALDLVLAADTVSLAIVDACPVSPNLRLSPAYMGFMHELQQHFLPESLGQRTIPDWGKAIFSPLCVCIRPGSPQELAGFIKYAVALTRMHLQFTTLLSPIEPTSRQSIVKLKELLAGHKRFCEQQLSNKKTSRVLEAAFDQEWTDSYMQELMFDYNPTDSPPWFDGSIAKLYEHFEDNPEPTIVEKAYVQTRQKLNYQTATEYLERIVAGDPTIKGPRMAFTFETLYQQDPEFKEAVRLTLPGAAAAEEAGTIGEFLAEYFERELMQAGQQQPPQQQQQPSGEGASAEQQQQQSPEQQQDGKQPPASS